MKFRDLIPLFIYCVSIFSLNAQFGRDEIKKSKIVKDEISLSIVDKDNLDLYIDTEDRTEKTLQEKDYFQVKSKEFRVYANFVNPFEYILRSSEKELDDELFIASEQFFQSVASYILDIQGFKSRMRTTRISSTETIKLEPELLDLYIQVESYNRGFMLTNNSFKKALGDLNFAEANKNIENRYKKSLEKLKELVEISEINKVISNNKRLLDKNNNDITSLKVKFESLKLEFGKIKFSTSQNYLQQHIKNKINVFEKKIQDLEVIKSDLDVKYDKIIELFKTIDERKHKLGSNKFLLSKIVNVKKSKRHEITLVLEKIKFNDIEKNIKIESSKSFVLNVRKKTTFIPVLSSGVLYTNLSFNQYGTDTNELGETIITQTEDKENELTIATYLNLYFNNNWDFPMFLQLGVGPSKEKPLFFLGGGIELISKFTLSSGAVFTWQPSLNDLSVGDVVGGSSIIEKDITYDFDLNPKFYIGISIDITGK